jgi:hypothetical protein
MLTPKWFAPNLGWECGVANMLVTLRQTVGLALSVFYPRGPKQTHAVHLRRAAEDVLNPTRSKK